MVTQSSDLGQYDYDLPQHLIAHRPSKERTEAKLMVYGMKSGKILHSRISELPGFIPKDHLLVCNNTKVFAARVKAKKITGGEAEVFFLTPFKDNQGRFEALIKARGKKSVGDRFTAGEYEFSIEDVLTEGFRIRFQDENLKLEDLHPTVPIPPYIRDGIADEQDTLDYQTSYAKHIGSIAAPTAGLHFNKQLLDKLEEQKIERANVTLHVGLGTFSPIRSENFKDHKMHSEKYFIEKENLEKIQSYKQNLIAVGTTSLRVLEASYASRLKEEFEADQMQETDIFLYPGKEIHSIKGLMTNFHLPKSSLLLLLSCFIGKDEALKLYKIAVEEEYRFFSYGDAMICLRDL